MIYEYGKEKGLFPVPEINQDKFIEKMNKLNKKAKKLNCPQVVFEEKERVLFRNKDNALCFILYQINHSEQIKINGWIFTAKLECLSGGNLISKNPSCKEEIPIKYRDISFSICEHCNINRKRNVLYIVKNETTQEFKSVGSSCLKDFLGHASPEHIAEYSFSIPSEEEFSDISDYISGSIPIVSLQSFIAQCISWVRKEGFITKSMMIEHNNQEYESKNYISHTGYKAFDVLTITNYQRMDYRNKNIYTEDDYKKSGEIIEIMNRYYDNQPEKDIDDFNNNLRVILKSGTVSYKQDSISAIILMRYYQVIGEKISYWIPENEKQKRASEFKFLNNEYIGTIKEKITKQVQIKYISEKSTQYGLIYIYKFISEDGYKMVWFSSNNINKNIGDKLYLSGTIKGYNEYKSEKETIITRCKIIS